jgi:hypothetical protein
MWFRNYLAMHMAKNMSTPCMYMHKIPYNDTEINPTMNMEGSFLWNSFSKIQE